jgi:hypothetical protein
MVEVMEEAVRVIMEGPAPAPEGAVGAIMGDMPTATAVAITGDMDMGGGVILIGGAILIAGVIPTGGITHTFPTMTPTTILITMRAMKVRQDLHKWLLLRRDQNNNLLIGTFVKTQRVTTLT